MSRTEFYRSVFEDDHKTFAACLRAGKLNEEEPNYGFNVCHVACAHERDEMLATLIDRGVNFEKATIKDVPDTITLFEWRGPAGSTPLMVAAQRGSLKCLKLLLRAGARLHPRDSKGHNATEYAEGECHRAISDTEVKREADVEATDEAQLLGAKATGQHTSTRSSSDVKLRALELVISQMNYCTDKLLRIDAPPPPSSTIPSAPATSSTPITPSNTPAATTLSSPVVVSSRAAASASSAQQLSGPTWNAASWNGWFVTEYSQLRHWRDTLLTDIVGPTPTAPRTNGSTS